MPADSIEKDIEGVGYVKPEMDKSALKGDNKNVARLTVSPFSKSPVRIKEEEVKLKLNKNKQSESKPLVPFQIYRAKRHTTKFRIAT